MPSRPSLRVATVAPARGERTQPRVPAYPRASPLPASCAAADTRATAADARAAAAAAAGVVDGDGPTAEIDQRLRLTSD